MAKYVFTPRQDRGSFCGVVANVLHCDIEENEFELQSHYYIHFRIYTLGKVWFLLPPPSMGRVWNLLFTHPQLWVE